MKRTFAVTQARFPGEDTPQGQRPGPRISEWRAATAGREAYVAFWPPLPMATALRDATLAPPAASDRRRQALLLAALRQAAAAPHYELVPVNEGHWLTSTLEPGERAFWCRRRGIFPDNDAQAEWTVLFPWHPDDVLTLFTRDTWDWAGRIRIGRIGVRPGQRGAAATGYVTARIVPTG